MYINFTETDGFKKDNMKTIVFQSLFIRLLSYNYLEIVIATSHYSVSDNRGTTGETKEATDELPRLRIEECGSSSYEDTKSVVSIEEDKKIYEEERKDPEIPPIQSKTKQLMVKEIAKPDAFYSRYRLFEDSKTMECLSGYGEKCRYCFDDHHNESECDGKVRIENIKRQWKFVCEILNLTGRVEEYLRVCDYCRLNLFKDLNESTIPCPFCSKELNDLN